MYLFGSTFLVGFADINKQLFNVKSVIKTLSHVSIKKCKYISKILSMVMDNN